MGPLFWEALPSGRLMQDVPTWRAYTGQPEPLPTAGWLDSVIHPDDRETTMLAWVHALQSGQPLSVTQRLRGADGVYRRFLMQATPVLDAQGAITHWRGVSCPLAEVEQERDRTQQRAQVFDATTDAVIVTDRAERITDWNAAAEMLFGFTRQEMLGQSPAVLRLPSAPTTQSAAVLETVLAQGEWRGELAYRRKDGTPSISMATVRALVDDQGAVVGTIGIHRDITTRTASEARLEAVLAQERATRRDLETVLAAAREAEAKFRTVVDRNIIGIFVADADAVLEANAAFLQMLDYAAEDVAARRIRWQDLTPPGWEAADDSASQELLARGACAPFEKVYLRRDGTPVPIILAGVLLSLQPLRIMAFALDITDRKRLEAAVAARAAELEAVFAAITDGIYVYNAAGELVQSNPAARLINPNLVDETYLATPFGERISAFGVRDAQGQPLPADQTPVARILRGEQLVGVDTQMRQPHGRDLQLSTSGGPVRATDGQINGAVIVTRDVTARYALERRTQEALAVLLRVAQIVTEPATQADVRMLLARLTEALSQLDGVDIAHALLVDETEPALRLEPVAMYHLPPAELAAWRASVSAFKPANDARVVQMAAYLRAGNVLVQRFPAETPIVSPFAVDRFHLGTGITAPVVVAGQLVGLLTIGRARTAAQGQVDEFAPWDHDLLAGIGRLAAEALERGRLSAQLTAAEAARLAAEAATRQRDEFLGIASHELRTPLTSIKANLQIAVRAIDQFVATNAVDARLARAHDLLQRSDRHIARLDRIVQDMIDMVRNQAGLLQFQIVRGDLSVVVREAVEEQRLLWPSRAIELALPPAPVVVAMDAGRIGQVVTNYLVNALKYAPMDTPIAVELALAEGTARVAVRDQGPGIAVAEQALVWDRFYRAPEAVVENGSNVGLGLGLYLCKTVIERHGGQVGLSSSPGHGATFWFTLPLATEPA